MAIVEGTAPEAIEEYEDRLAQQWRRERRIDVARTIFVVVSIDDRTMQVMPGAGFPPVERGARGPGSHFRLAGAVPQWTVLRGADEAEPEASSDRRERRTAADMNYEGVIALSAACRPSSPKLHE